ncbi:hypothetical protein RRG08_021249 [Elysia crispata]|uniref:Uncharacterized protein n=1 Tax=Elysia crispata TaxID=231223 RepID=A0AAE0YY79_9GAST|nr:hypothetical protein RRG08_021249 [Elysia crispata]
MGAASFPSRLRRSYQQNCSTIGELKMAPGENIHEGLEAGRHQSTVLGSGPIKDGHAPRRPTGLRNNRTRTT